MLIIHCNISGFNGQPVTLISTLSDNNVLSISKSIKFTNDRITENCAFIGNAGSLEKDFIFTDAHFNDGILAYFDRKAMESIAIDNSVTRFSPDSRIEIDKIDSSGRSYRLDQTIENGQIAILCTALFAKKQEMINSVNDFYDDLEDMYDSFSI